jgi:outer membrane lipoprotein SlyB
MAKRIHVAVSSALSISRKVLAYRYLFQEHFMALTFTPCSLVSLLASGLLLGACSLGAQAQTWSSNPQPAPTAKEVKARYEADKKLCADEASSEARLQCRRDAQVVYDKALAASKVSKAIPANKAGTVYTSQSAQPVCTDCGHVTAVTVADKPGDSNAVGLIAGGVAGAVLGHQVGGGLGKDLATIAGAAGGAYAGKKIQENMNTSKVWTVSVKYTDGHTANFTFEQDPGLAVGTAVKNSGNTLVRN